METQLSNNVTVSAPRLLTYTDLPTAINTTFDAFKDDPLHRYGRETPDSHDSVLYRTSRQAEFSARYIELIHQGTVWTIEDGASIVGYTPAKVTTPGWSLDKLLQWVLPYLFSYKAVLFSKEQNKRAKEFKEKVKKAVEEHLGSRQDDMIYLYVAVTSPAKQGHGYASTLIRLVTAKADEEKRSVWLISSNIKNTGFYNSVGFKTKAEILMGDDNPTWTEPPIVVSLMVREYEERGEAL